MVRQYKHALCYREKSSIDNVMLFVYVIPDVVTLNVMVTSPPFSLSLYVCLSLFSLFSSLLPLSWSFPF